MIPSAFSTSLFDVRIHEVDPKRSEHLVVVAVDGARIWQCVVTLAYFVADSS